MPRCRTCDEYVTENYVQVFAPLGVDFVGVCPNCKHDAPSA
jgi:hypothetical protein